MEEELIALALEQAADAIVVSDAKGTIRAWNASAAHLFGIPADEALGRSLDIIIPERLREAHWAGFHKAVETGAMRLAGAPTVTRALHPTGRRLYVEMSFALVRGHDGRVLGAVAVARDATARMAERSKPKE
jgi:PAS domain S-box-containing protein